MGKLYVVATPIGNLEDITLRALRILKEVNLIACEDTRHTKILLNHYNIKTPTISYHQHSRIKKVDELIRLMKEGKDIALVTDAGTPGISDPGVVLISYAIESKIDIVSIPGPSAFLAAASVSGLPLNNFLYLGFLPKKKGRKTLLKNLKTKELKNKTIIFYESPYRIIKTLEELQEFLGDREVVVCRELTKKFEQTYRGRISEVLPQIKPKGEFVVLVKGSDVSYQHGSAADNSQKDTDNKQKSELLYENLSYKIRGIAIEIRKLYGTGHKEKVYQKAFEEELGNQNIDFKKEGKIKVLSPKTGKLIGIYQPDFIIDDKIILEIKALNFAPKKLENQLFDYLRNSEYQLGFFINFGGRKLYIKRIIYTNEYK